MSWLITLLIMVVGGLVLGLGSYLARQQRERLAATGRRARGVVVRYELRCRRVATVTECVVRFTTAQGRLVEAAPPHGITTLVPAYRVGEAVAVMYNAADPTDFMVL